MSKTVCTVIFHGKDGMAVYSAPDDGRKGRPKHVELLTPNKEHRKVASR